MLMLFGLVLAVGLANSQDSLSDVVLDNKKCDVGQFYDAEDLVCRDDCDEGKTYNREVKGCVVITPLPTKKKARPFCKNITLHKSQYEWINKKQIFVAELNLTVEAVGPKDGERTLCFNFSDTFMTCRRWLLDSHEIEVRNQGLKVWVPVYDHLYDTGDFYLHAEKDGLFGAVVCSRPAKTHTVEQTALRLYYASWIISEICLIIAFILCLTLPQFSFMYHILPFYIGSLFLAYLILILRSLLPSPVPAACYFYAVALQFAFLAAFFWLNVLSFDIWRTLAKRQWYLEMFNRNAHRLIGFSVYAFGIPFLIVFLTILVDVYQLGTIDVQPQFLKSCWFTDDISKLLFFYGPVALILAVNVVLFIMTLIGLKTNEKGLFRDSIEKKHLWRTALELAVLMGLCWIMEVVSWAVKADPTVWYFTDVINGLQGLFILIVILTKPKVFVTVWQWLTSCCKTQESTPV